MRAIFIAAGDGTRWKNYKGVPKHLVEINNERLIDRATRLASQYTNDVYVLGPDERYKNDYSQLHVPILNKNNYDADKFMSSIPLWSTTERTIIFYGDVYFTKNAMKTICENDRINWTMFCRHGRSFITGTPWGENFAFSFYPEQIELVKSGLNRLVSLCEEKKLWRCGGWELITALNGAPDNQVALSKYRGKNTIEINDWTDDIDYPKDYDRLINNMNNAIKNGQSVD